MHSMRAWEASTVCPLSIVPRTEFPELCGSGSLTCLHTHFCGDFTELVLLVRDDWTLESHNLLGDLKVADRNTFHGRRRPIHQLIPYQAKSHRRGGSRLGEKMAASIPGIRYMGLLGLRRPSSINSGGLGDKIAPFKVNPGGQQTPFVNS